MLPRHAVQTCQRSEAHAAACGGHASAQRGASQEQHVDVGAAEGRQGSFECLGCVGGGVQGGM